MTSFMSSHEKSNEMNLGDDVFNDGRGNQCSADNEIITSWKDRIDASIARSRKIRGGNYVQIATVDPAGKPKCRTVVFRGFLPPNEFNPNFSMKMITDARSEKVSQLTSSPEAEIVWWFPKSSEQYRIAGQVHFVNDNEQIEVLKTARQQMWGNLSDPAREQFYWLPPGEPHTPISGIPTGGRDAEGTILPVPENFLLMLLYPQQVKYLRLTDNYSQFDKCSEGLWISERVNP